MNSLLEHGVEDRITPILCAFERGRTEREDSDCGCKMRLFAPRSGEERGSGMPVDGIAGSREIALRCESPRFNSSPTRSLLRGQCDARQQARSSAFTVSIEILFGKNTEKIYAGPSANAELRPWESRPLAWRCQV